MEKALLENFLSALSLSGKASNGPHLDLHTSVKLLASHVPHAMAWGGYCTIL